MCDIVNVKKCMKLVEIGFIKEYCFLVINKIFLEIENCSESYVYICERFEGKEYIKFIIILEIFYNL